MHNHARFPGLFAVAALSLMVLGLGASPQVAHAATNRCALAKDAEIAEAIGPHGRGTSDENNPWGFNSCQWVATNAPAKKAPEGWRDSIEIAVFEGSMASWAKGQAHGEPIEGVAKDATWDRSQAELWFACAGGRVCVVKVRTAESKERQAIATKLAKLVDSRLH